MQATYGDDVQFMFIYCREAHAADSDRPAGKDVEQPVSTDERREVASAFLDEMKLEIPALLDNIDDKTSLDYASHPDRLYLVGKDGNIAYAGEKGPRGFKVDELEQAIKTELAGEGGESAGSKSSTPGDRRGGPQMGGAQSDRRMRMMSMMMPTLGAMNTDGDNHLSAEEIEAAAETLLSLDKDGDGSLSAEELRPNFGGGGGFGGGRRR